MKYELLTNRLYKNLCEKVGGSFVRSKLCYAAADVFFSNLFRPFVRKKKNIRHIFVGRANNFAFCVAPFVLGRERDCCCCCSRIFAFLFCLAHLAAPTSPLIPRERAPREQERESGIGNQPKPWLKHVNITMPLFSLLLAHIQSHSPASTHTHTHTQMQRERWQSEVLFLYSLSTNTNTNPKCSLHFGWLACACVCVRL